MQKQEKLAALSKAMTQSERPDGTKFYHFTEEAPEELQSLYFEHYEVRDVDYETFADSCSLVSELYAEGDESIVEDGIYERSSDRASYYNVDRLAYISIWNQDEVSDIVKEFDIDICGAAAVWYERQVEQAAMIIHNWIQS